jgi:hypothetical protein
LADGRIKKVRVCADCGVKLSLQVVNQGGRVIIPNYPEKGKALIAEGYKGYKDGYPTN